MPLEWILRMMPSMEVLLMWQAGLKDSVQAVIKEQRFRWQGAEADNFPLPAR